MKFKFNKNLDYQLEAIQSIVDIFDTGKNIIQTDIDFRLQSEMAVVANQLEIDDKRIVRNMNAIQEMNGIEKTEVHPCGGFGSSAFGSATFGGVAKVNHSFDFSVEMETGTGKTYVYLRTIFELNKKYGLKKFIILVPSVAIREGVLKTIEQTKAHFREIYNVGFGHFAYDSSKLSKVKNFASSFDIQIMVMTIQAFNSDLNIMRQTPDRFNGDRPIDRVAATNPVIIMDEPQNMETELSKSAIKDLKPLFKLRYSATHKTKHNLMYVLSPVDAYRKRLVKKIEVYGVDSATAGDLVFKLRGIVTEKNKSPRAKVGLEIKNVDGEFVGKDLVLRAGDELVQLTKNDKYIGLMVNEINAKYGSVELSNGSIFKLEEQALDKEAVFRAQIKETIRAHFEKQEELGKEIKVLSLFFIDRVDNYVLPEGIIRKIFTEEFDSLKRRSEHFQNVEVDKVHNGYFANAKIKGETIYKETNGRTKLDKEVYDLIMKDKERLLSFEEPTCFIFSHSALKEGWDNPNIFQICTLRETNSPYLKRQEIGRGLRLPVDVNGNRIFDEKINVLTVVPNESYRDFVGGLQTEYNDAGYREAPKATNAREKVAVLVNKKRIESEEFKNLWERIRKRTKFNIEIDTDKLIRSAAEAISSKVNVDNLVIRVNKVLIDINEQGKMKTVFEGESIGERLNRDVRIGNICDRISKETGITRKTVFEILSSVNNLDLVFKNPEEYLRSVIVIISSCLNDLLINEGLKYLPTEDMWEVSLFEEWQISESRVLASEKSVYDHVVYDSDGERAFASSLEESRSVKLFTKLPPKFVVDTPLGTYNPDWAIVYATDEGDKLYLVRETKFGGVLGNLRKHEEEKILCGKKHFDAIGVDFKPIKSEDLSDLR